jgi:hypothetical protein
LFLILLFSYENATLPRHGVLLPQQGNVSSGVFADKLAFCLSVAEAVGFFGCSANLNMSALLELYIIAMLVSYES